MPVLWLATHTQVMADLLEDDFALSDVESIQGDFVNARESDTDMKKPAKKRQVSQESEEMEETEEEKRARKKRKMKQQDKNRKAKVS